LAIATISNTRSRNVHRADFPTNLWERWFYRNSKDRTYGTR